MEITVSQEQGNVPVKNSAQPILFVRFMETD